MITLTIITAIVALLAIASFIKSNKLKKELEEHQEMLKKLRIENFQFQQAFERNIDKFEDHWGDAR